MPRFFIDEPIVDFFNVTGDNAYHILKSLRMKVGEELTLCCDGMDYFCEIVNCNKDSVDVKLLDVQKCESEPNIKVTLFQGLPKGDKMDLIVQKVVEVGVYNVVPVLTQRCVSRPDEKAIHKKLQRWNKIALEAAKQSGRGYIPSVGDVLDFDKALKLIGEYDKIIIFYEGGGEHISKVINNSNIKSVAVFIGPEGGFERSEVSLIAESGGKICSLGNRILRTETAAIISTASIIYENERSKI